MTKSMIPDDQNYEEYCKYCDSFYVPHWTRCDCEKGNIRRIDIDKILKKMKEDEQKE